MTAVDWIVDQMFKQGYFDGNKPLSITNLDHLQHQAKEMEKQMVIDIVEKSRATGLTAEYLLLTYGSKGSDEHHEDNLDEIYYTKQDVIDAIIKIHEIYSLHGQYNDTLEAKKLRLKGVSWHIQNILESLKKDKI